MYRHKYLAISVFSVCVTTFLCLLCESGEPIGPQGQASGWSALYEGNTADAEAAFRAELSKAIVPILRQRLLLGLLYCEAEKKPLSESFEATVTQLRQSDDPALKSRLVALSVTAALKSGNVEKGFSEVLTFIEAFPSAFPERLATADRGASPWSSETPTKSALTQRLQAVRTACTNSDVKRLWTSMVLAQWHRKAGEYELAETILKPIADEAKDSKYPPDVWAEARMELADLFFETARRPLTDKIYESVEQDTAVNGSLRARAVMERANFLYDKGDFEAATRLHLRAQNEFNDTSIDILAESLRHMGWIAFQRKNFNEAQRVFSEVRKRFPQARKSIQAATAFSEGLTLFKLGQAEVAEGILQDALRTLPDAPVSTRTKIRTELARQYQGRGQLDDADKELQKATIEIAACVARKDLDGFTSARCIRELIEIFMQRRKEDAALQPLIQSLDFLPPQAVQARKALTEQYVRCVISHVEALEHKGPTEESSAFVTDVLGRTFLSTLQRRQLVDRLALTLLGFSKGKFIDDAVTQLTRLLQSYTGERLDHYAPLAIAKACFQLEDFNNIDRLVRPLAQAPGVWQCEALLLKAQVLLKENKSADALVMFERISSEFPKSPQCAQACFVIGWLNLSGGKDEAARAAFEKVAKHHSDSEYAAKANELLNRMTPVSTKP